MYLQACKRNVIDLSLTHPSLGCYPKCPVDQPYFDEVTMKCVKKESCGCYYKAKHYNDGDEVPSTQNCQKW